MIVVIKVIKTCNAVPAQWEGTTADNRCVYARYRWGVLRVGVGKDPEEAVRAGGNVYGPTQVGDPFHGDMSYDTLKRLTQNAVSWPDAEELKYPGEGDDS